MDLLLNNRQWFICHKTKLNKIKAPSLFENSLQKYENIVRYLHLANLIHSKKVKLATVIEGDQEAAFSIAITPRCRGGRYSFTWIDPLNP